MIFQKSINTVVLSNFSDQSIAAALAQPIAWVWIRDYLYIWPMKDGIGGGGAQKLHHQAPKLDVRQHILNHLHQSYPCDSQPTGSRHGPLCLSPRVQIRWSLVLFYAHHSQSEVIIITPFYLLIAQSERAVCLLQINDSSLKKSE